MHAEFSRDQEREKSCLQLEDAENTHLCSNKEKPVLPMFSTIY